MTHETTPFINPDYRGYSTEQLERLAGKLQAELDARAIYASQRDAEANGNSFLSALSQATYWEDHQRIQWREPDACPPYVFHQSIAIGWASR